MLIIICLATSGESPKLLNSRISAKPCFHGPFSLTHAFVNIEQDLRLDLFHRALPTHMTETWKVTAPRRSVLSPIESHNSTQRVTRSVFGPDGVCARGWMWRGQARAAFNSPSCGTTIYQSQYASSRTFDFQPWPKAGRRSDQPKSMTCIVIF